MTEPDPAAKKIIVDEDWKTQVEAEREALRRQGEASSPAAVTEPKAAPPPLPPPTFSYLCGTLYFQAAIGLGMLPNPLAENKVAVDLPRAKHAIDTLAMLEEKTAGNRTAEEAEELDAMLHQLRMAFVEVSAQ